MSGFRPFLDSNLGAAFFFFSSVSMACSASLNCFKLYLFISDKAAFLTSLLLPAPCHTGKIYCQQHHPQNLRK
jgi:hypothetical protein